MVTLDGNQYGWTSSMTIFSLLVEAGVQDSCYIVKLNGEYLLRTEFRKRYLADQSSVSTVPLIAGG